MRHEVGRFDSAQADVLESMSELESLKADVAAHMTPDDAPWLARGST